MTDVELEALAAELEALIFDAGYSIKGSELRKVLRDGLPVGELCDKPDATQDSGKEPGV